MMTVGSSRKLLYTDNNLPTPKGKRENVSYNAISPPIKINMRKGEAGSAAKEIMLEASVSLRKYKGLKFPFVNRIQLNQKLCMSIKALSSTEKHLSSLNDYLVKLHDDAKEPSSKILNERTKSTGESDQFKAVYGLRSLENYLARAKEPDKYVDKDFQESTNSSSMTDQGSEGTKIFMEFKPEDAKEKLKFPDEDSDFYLIGVLASINIAIFLFEIATPVKNSSFELFSLPMVYGAKINNLILTGEWWRLVTPMFLHSGIFHIALGIWVLFTFGLQVSREYGSFTFLLIYFLGGISGNLISFLHTPESTVGGTGPAFAIIGAWLISQVQNKEVIARDDSSERMFQNAIIATTLSFVLSSFGPIDDWAHFAAAFTGVSYGFFTCPALQVKDASPESGRQERITLVRRNADPCKSLAFFSLFILLMSSLLFIIEPPLYLIE